MQLDIKIQGDKQKHIVKALELVLELLRNGSQAGGGIAAHDVRYTFEVEESCTDSHKNFMDGEGNIIHVDEEGHIEAILNKDGEPDPTASHVAMTAEAWGEAHGGLREMPRGRLKAIEVPEELKEAFMGLLKGAMESDEQKDDGDPKGEPHTPTSGA